MILRLMTKVHRLTMTEHLHNLNTNLELSMSLKPIWVLPITTIIWSYTGLYIPYTRSYTSAFANYDKERYNNDLKVFTDINNRF